MDQRTLWCVISPVFKPASGGGAIYNDILARTLARAGDDVIVWVEKYPGHPAVEQLDAAPGTAKVRRTFPHRAARARKDLLSYIAYAASNASYILLPSQIRQAAQNGYARVRILLHASFLYNLNLFPVLLDRLKNTGVADSKLLLDVRDYSLPASKAPLLARFDGIIASSQGVAEFLISERGGDGRILPILMPFERPIVPDPDETRRVLERHGLAGKRFLLNPNGISLAKHSDVIREGASILRRDPRFSDALLVIAGRERDRATADSAAERRGDAIYLGNVEHRELHSLMKAAMFTVILSNREAISRSALEAMAVGGRVLLPDLPEFNRDCASHVVSEVSGAALASKIVQLHDMPMPAYQFSDHEPEAFVPLYRSI